MQSYYSKKPTPTVKRYHWSPKIKETSFPEVTTLDELLPLAIDLSVYTSASPQEFLSLFRELSTEQITGLAHREWVSIGDVLVRLHSDREHAYLVVRQANRYGVVVNFSPEGSNRSPDNLIPFLVKALKSKNLPHGDLRTPGHVSDQILRQYLDINRLPKEPHLNRFVNSFRGPRFEAVLFGLIRKVNDYDISSAYPSELAQAHPTTPLDWIDSKEDHIASSVYAAALITVHIPEDLKRGPIAYRFGEHALFWPVGKLPRCFVNLPELQYLKDAGYRFTIHEASWGVPKFAEDYSPYFEPVNALYRLRKKYPDCAEYFKTLSLGLYGRLISSHNGETGPTYNPVIASHITSSIRMRLQRMADDDVFIGEYCDGFATLDSYKQTKGMGGLKLEGSGDYISITDMFKQSDWKKPAIPFVEAIPTSEGKIVTTELNAVVGTASIATGLAEPRDVGRMITHTVHMRVGPVGRIPTSRFTAKDLLTDIIDTDPPTVDAIPAFQMFSANGIPGALAYDLAT